MRLDDLPTPALLLDLERLEANIARMAARAREFGVRLRPHVKTHKCVDIAERQRAAGARGITVSTLYEARVFGDHGFDDITWAYPFVLNRVEEARELAERSRLGMRARLNLVVDAEAAVTALEESGHPFAVWLKVDSGYHRAGVDPESALAVELARRLSASAVLTFAGLLSHSGHAYQGRTRAEIARIAERDRKTMVTLAEALREQGVPVAAVSVGSTPAVLAARHLQGVDEIRPGNYAFFDYTQCELKSCTPADCAVTVLASVASSQPGSKHSVVDAGALALSKDAGPNGRSHASMGRIFSDYSAGTLEPTRRLVSLSQEHGIVNGRLDVGARIRILPNHSCLAVAQFDEYHVVSGDRVVERWKIWRGR